jgi:hypothetical protein
MARMERLSVRLMMALGFVVLALLDTRAFDPGSPPGWLAIMAFSPLVGSAIGALFGRPLRGATLALPVGTMTIPVFFLVSAALRGFG